jgi:integrase/recombinase XerD
MLLSDLLDEFVLYCRSANRSTRTIEWYMENVTAFEKHLLTSGRPHECERITTRIIREYVLDLQGRYSEATVAGRIRAIKALFAWGVREELLTTDPTKRVPVPKIPHTDFEVFDTKQVDTILKACDTKQLQGCRDFAVVMVLFDSGIRASELIGITQQDIDWERGLVRVFGKGAKERQVPVSARTLRAIRRYLSHRRKAGHDHQPSVFLNNDGDALTYSGLAQLLRRLGTRTGLHIHPHKFRHSFAVNALRNDAREFDIQDCLGHTTLFMTKHYARQSAVDLSERHRRFSPADRLKTRV